MCDGYADCGDEEDDDQQDRCSQSAEGDHDWATYKGTLRGFNYCCRNCGEVSQ